MAQVQRSVLFVSLMLAAAGAGAETLRGDHPLIGTWRITSPNGCSETYVVRPDGTASINSGEEVAESEVTISDQPSALGFFKLVEKTVKDNGKKDCSGDVTPIGRVSTSYVILHSGKDMFALCEHEDRSACIGPYKRIK